MTPDPHPPAIAKPPYRVPTMAEIRAMPPNSLTVVSTFSGCGGSCLGFRMAGYRVLWASEFIPAAQDSYRANASPKTHLDTRDIREVKARDILRATGLGVGDLDVFEGSPPCSSFSSAGKREANWGKVKKYSDGAQRTDDLFFEYARLLEGLKPRAFVAENVAGLVRGTAKGYFKVILARLRECGYRVEAKVLDAQWLGVPQARQRLIFIGVRDDLGRAPAFPKPLPYRYSVRDALPGLSAYRFDTSGSYGKRDIDVRRGVAPAITVSGNTAAAWHHQVSGPEFNGEWQSPDLPAKTIGAGPQTGNGRVGSGDVQVAAYSDEDISRYAIGREYDSLLPGGQSEKYFQLVRADAGKPSPTITSRGGDRGVAAVTHPTQRRKFTIAELRRICAFPDDFQLAGTYAQQWERLGRAVPPVMMRAIAETLRDRVLT